MSHQSIIFNALRLPTSDVDHLMSGQMIAAMPQTFLRLGQQFGLYPDDPNLHAGNVLVKAWARCELCQPIDSSEALGIISHLTVWSVDTLQSILAQRGSLWLAYLRVYLLPSQVEVPIKTTGQFIPLTNPITVTDDLPVISDRDFVRLKQQLENLESPEPLDVQIQRMLEEAEIQQKIDSSNKLNWIKTIVTLGDRSIETDTGKNNWQAGTDFENITKRSLEFLGFTIDESHKGGAGGLDLFCSKPYPLTGECKAGKNIPNRTVEELIRLGGTHLGVEGFINLSAKLVIGAGNPTTPMIDAAQEWKVSIIKAMTLQKLVELKAKYDGAINLFELKTYLQAGQIDAKIDEYIQKVESDIKLRSHIIQLVKNANKTVGIEYLCGVYDASKPTQSLRDRELHEILIELSSPLTGYLGREKSNSNWRGDRFYFLRDLPIEKET